MAIGPSWWLAVFMAALAVSTGSAAQRPSHDAERAKDSDICGYRLMTERERVEYRSELQSAPSDRQRERIRELHRQQMLARARERGFSLSCGRTPNSDQDTTDGAPRDALGSRPLSPATVAEPTETGRATGQGACRLDDKATAQQAPGVRLG